MIWGEGTGSAAGSGQLEPMVQSTRQHTRHLRADQMGGSAGPFSKCHYIVAQQHAGQDALAGWNLEVVLRWKALCE